MQTFEITDTITGRNLGFYFTEAQARFATSIIRNTEYVSVSHSPSCYCGSDVHLPASVAAPQQPRTLTPCYCDYAYHPKGC